jgi:hypothetical protein
VVVDPDDPGAVVVLCPGVVGAVVEVEPGDVVVVDPVAVVVVVLGGGDCAAIFQVNPFGSAVEAESVSCASQ